METIYSRDIIKNFACKEMSRVFHDAEPKLSTIIGEILISPTSSPEMKECAINLFLLTFLNLQESRKIPPISSFYTEAEIQIDEL